MSEKAKDKKAKGKKEEGKSGGLDSVLKSVTELGEVCVKAMADKCESKQKHESYPCWICSNNVSSGASVGCEDCDAWAHAKCVKLPDTLIGYLNKGYRVGIKVHCDSCLSNKDQNGVSKEIRELKQIMETQKDETQKLFVAQRDLIHKLTGNIDNLNKEMKLMTAEMKLIKDENKGLEKICSEIRDENMNAKSATNTQTPSYASIAKNALIVKSADSGSITEKKVQIAKALSEVPIDKTRETTNGALIMNFRDKTNMEKAKKAMDDASNNIGTTTKIGNTYAPRIMLTYMNLTKDNDDDDDADVDDADTRDIFKKRIIEGLVRKNEGLKNEFQHEDDLRVVQMRETSKNKKLKHVTLKCSPRIRKVIKDNNDQLYFESQVYRVYDSYHVVICHHCQKMGHIASKCPDKNDGKSPICGKCAGTHETRKCNEMEKKCVNCVRRGITVNIDHGTYDKNCPVYQMEKTRVQNNTDNGY